MRGNNGKLYYMLAILLAHLLWLGYALFSKESGRGGTSTVFIAISSMVVQIILGYLTFRKLLILDEKGSNLFLFLALLLYSSNTELMSGGGMYIYAAPLFILSLIILLGAYHTDEGSITIASSGLLFGFSVPLWPPVLYTLPLWFLFLYLLRSVTPRQIVAFLFGMFLSWWLALPLLFFSKARAFLLEGWMRMSNWAFPSEAFNTYTLISHWIYPLILLSSLLWAISATHLTVRKEKVRIRSFFAILTVWPLYLLPFYLFLPKESAGMLYLSLLPSAVLLAKAIETVAKRYQAWIITSLCTVFIVLLVLQTFLG
ncbi:hypothetical protein PORCRE_290 [Porphyromonas crevioricanis JCM 15906]|uniref:Uncharacterized protein n=2 Tax=Porphyromonas crevioricanis TaxID=393921 RepID=T1DQ82_9PORP|nr:hypothetical protein PORCRE_290 [Porphyromonas crevioricanis JCM 15906]SJZ68144.1 hypothetical protein SAMN02745203_00539 [Porphyromonas crevioricanis]